MGNVTLAGNDRECSADYYLDTSLSRCFLCASECEGCLGSTAEDCILCKYSSATIKSENGLGVDCKDFPKPEPFFSIEAIITTIVAGIPLFFVSCCVCLCVCCYYCGKRTAGGGAPVINPAVLAIRKPSEARAPALPPNLSKFRTIDEAKLRKDSVLGKGKFGIVYRGVWAPEKGVKIPVAIKLLHGTNDPSESRGFVNEAFLMAGTQHQNLLRMLGLCLGSSGIMLVSQLMPLGSLLHYLRIHKEDIGSKSMLNWCMQIAMGMEHLESSRIVHRDLAARNVVLETPNSIKITDFGLAKMLNARKKQCQNGEELLPIRWAALESFKELSFSHKSDVWAFGVTVWEILTCGKIPFKNLPPEKIMSLLDRGERLEQPENCTIDMYMVLIRTWMPDPESRPTFKELVVDYSEMCEDPGRYLVIQNDELKRLPKYTVEDEKELIQGLANAEDCIEDYMTAEQYTNFERDKDGYLLPAGQANLPDSVYGKTEPRQSQSAIYTVDI